MVKVAQKRESSQIQIEDVRCVTVQAKSVEIHVNVHLTEGCVFVKACPMYVDGAHTHAAVEVVSAVAAAEKQPSPADECLFSSFSFSRGPFRVPLRGSSLLLCASSLYSSPADLCGGERRILSLRRRNHLVDDVD